MDARTLQEKFLAKITDSGLTPEDAKRLRFAPLSAEKVRPLKLKYSVPGFKIPYFSPTGVVSDFFRFRYLEETLSGFEKLVEGAKNTRYVQPAGTAPQLYFPPLGVTWPPLLMDQTQRLVFTEGELKAACACKNGVPTVGLGGVWAFRGGGRAMVAGFESINFKERDVIICYDSDAVLNEKVRAAEIKLAQELTKAGARVGIARIPRGAGAKAGIDDFIVAHGVRAFQEVLDAASPFAAAAELHQLNTEVIFVRDPGFIVELATKQRMSALNFAKVHYAPRRHELPALSDKTPARTVSTAEEWIKWAHRAEVSSLTYAPGQPEITERNELNMWRGFNPAVVPRRGNLRPWVQLLDAMFGDEHVARKWFERWCAYPFQHPGTKLRSAVVLWSVMQGVGKSLVGLTLGALYGSNFASIGDTALDPDHDFNSWAKNKQFILADDITGNSSRKLANKLKVMVTRETVEINEKFLPQYTLPDCINYMFTSNEPDAFRIEAQDRRFLVHQVRDDAKQSPEFYAEYDAWYKAPPTHAGLGALLHHFLTLPMEDAPGVNAFNPMGAPPMTNSKREMHAASSTDLELWVTRFMEDPHAFSRGQGGDLFTLEEIKSYYNNTGATGDVSLVLLSRKLVTAGAVRLNIDGATSTGQFKSGGRLIKPIALLNTAYWRKRHPVATVRKHFEAHRPLQLKSDRKY